MQKRNFLYLLLLLLIVACTPKVVEEVITETPKIADAVDKDEKLSACKKFVDSGDERLAREKYVLYRDKIKTKDYKGAYELWKEVYEMAPAADGRRNTVYADGVKIYQHFMTETTDDTKQKEYVDNVFKLYDEIAECYPGDQGYVYARKGFDLFYKYPSRATDKEQYDLFQQSIAIDGMKTRDFIINPYTDLMIRLFNNKEISMAEAQKNASFITKRIEEGLKNCKGTYCERWKTIKDYAPSRLEEFEGVRGFYDCNYYQNKYYSEYLANKTDCEVIDLTIGRFLWANCAASDAKLLELRAAKNTNCKRKVPPPSPTTDRVPTTARQAYDALQVGDFVKSVDLYEQAGDEVEDNEKKAGYYFSASKVTYAHLKKYSKSRSLARKALKHRPNWGDPYILIGKLYASSGPLCGSGRGFESQRVVWVAIDQWNKAKSVDPSVSAQANKLIGQYRKYMPKKEDVFMNNLKNGQSYTVPCWIQERTKIRSVD